MSGSLQTAQYDKNTNQSPGPNLPTNNVVSILGKSGAAVTITGTTNEMVMANLLIPGGCMGANGSLRVTLKWSYTNSANNKTMTSYLPATVITQVVRTAANSDFTFFTIDNRNSQQSQLKPNAAIPVGGSTGTFSVIAIDMSKDQLFQITAQLANAGEFITLESWCVELMPSA